MPATMKDIARRTGLGLATISKYLNGGHVLEKNRIAIEAAIEELDFTVNEFARNLKTSKSHTIGVVIPELGNLFTTTIVTALEDTLRRHGYGIIISDCRTNERLEKEAVRFLLGKMVDGIINMPVNQGGGHLLPALEKNIPVVLIDRMIPSLSGRVNAVLIDNAAPPVRPRRCCWRPATGISAFCWGRRMCTPRASVWPALCARTRPWAFPTAPTASIIRITARRARMKACSACWPVRCPRRFSSPTTR